MLSVNKYPLTYIDQCRSRMNAQLAAYRNLAAGPARDVFEPLFLGHLVVVLDGYFVHRSRALELKDGNPCNEVRMIGFSVLQGDGILTADKTIKYKAATSITKLEVGDPIRLSLEQFDRLAAAYFEDIVAKFS